MYIFSRKIKQKKVRNRSARRRAAAAHKERRAPGARTRSWGSSAAAW